MLTQTSCESSFKTTKVSSGLVGGYSEFHGATVRTPGTKTTWFPVKKGVRQWCVLLPYLFNILVETVTREADDGCYGGLQTGDRRVLNLRYVDDTVHI